MNRDFDILIVRRRLTYQDEREELWRRGSSSPFLVPPRKAIGRHRTVSWLLGHDGSEGLNEDAH